VAVVRPSRSLLWVAVLTSCGASYLAACCAAGGEPEHGGALLRAAAERRGAVERQATVAALAVGEAAEQPGFDRATPAPGQRAHSGVDALGFMALLAVRYRAHRPIPRARPRWYGPSLPGHHQRAVVPSGARPRQAPCVLDSLRFGMRRRRRAGARVRSSAAPSHARRAAVRPQAAVVFDHDRRAPAGPAAARETAKGARCLASSPAASMYRLRCSPG
jgi:hypothetical protein